jgi:hypothetical protein
VTLTLSHNVCPVIGVVSCCGTGKGRGGVCAPRPVGNDEAVGAHESMPTADELDAIGYSAIVMTSER